MRSLAQEQIARRAYEIWLAEGCPAGRDLENWLEAERQLRSAREGRQTSDLDESLAARVQERLEDITADAPPRSPTSLDF